MSDQGLTHRLRQRSRRAGLMIGISMVVTIAFCAVAFTVIYTSLEGFTADFVSGSDNSGPVAEQESDSSDESILPPEAPSFSLGDDDSEEPESDAAPNNQESLPTPTPVPVADDDEEENADEETEDENEDGEFDPDFQLRNGSSINLREGPSTADSILDTLPAATPLEYLGEDAPTDSPRDGDRWMMFRTEDGLEGWIREIDTTDYVP